LQALVTLNDPVYQEAAEALARRVAKETAAKSAGNNPDARLIYETRLVLSRDPTPGELAAMRSFFAKALAMSTQPSVVRASTNVSNNEDSRQELAALAAVGSLLFNLDAALTR
jgi:hypothetical protein